MLQINAAGLAIIKEFESCVLVAYPDSGSDLDLYCKKKKIKPQNYAMLANWQAYNGAPWTIGWGQSNGITPGMKWTQKQADADLLLTIADRANDVIEVSERFGGFIPNENQLAALTSFVYNVGRQNLIRCMKNSNFPLAGFEAFANRMLLYNKRKGIFKEGLARRRQKERELFLTKVDYE